MSARYIKHVRQPSGHGFLESIGHYRTLRIGFVSLCLLLPIVTLYNVSGRQTRLFLPSCDLKPEGSVWNASQVVLGEPTPRFRDNMKKDVRYVTSLPSAGWTNDVMAYGNLIYLAIISDRVPVLPPFAPTHVGEDIAPLLPFSEVFDLPRLSQSLLQPVIEWSDLKVTSPEKETEVIGCWDVWTFDMGQAAARTRLIREHLDIDISYTKAPATFVNLFPEKPKDRHRSFWAVAALGYPEKRNTYLPESESRPSELKNMVRRPDEDMMCVDYMYYFGVVTEYEYTTDFSPVWKQVGQYMRWNPWLQRIADRYIGNILGVPEHEPLPDYIGVHVRHADFKGWCDPSTATEDCFAPISTITRRVRQVQEETLAKKGVDVPSSRVIITSDEDDPNWWKEIYSLGWKSVNHTKFDTVEMYDPWYPVLIDAVIQSSGIGFVGTDRSTMSLMAQLRVKSWRNGATRMVKWGKKGADDD